jgi:citrate lyase beta subunit
MKHHSNHKNFNFVIEPECFDKYSGKEFLQYCLGATMYMPGTKDFTKNILSKRWPELTSMVMCFEDAISENQLPDAEKNVHEFLINISNLIHNKELNPEELPLIIIRVRSYEQFVNFTEKLSGKELDLITAFNFPKFDSSNAISYLEHLKKIRIKHNIIVYGMPILESRSIAFKETRGFELLNLKNILNDYKDLILNIRVGGTDFSSYFGVRRGIDYTIYDIIAVRDCLSDIINYLGRERGFTISGPVWEYFSISEKLKLQENLPERLQKSFFTRTPFVDDAVDGLIREIILDKANGFVGKTVIHPSHVKYVNAMCSVTREEYEDAKQILDAEGGVVKSKVSNKMNEINPHLNWAKKTILRSRAYGVIENEKDYYKLFWS